MSTGVIRASLFTDPAIVLATIVFGSASMIASFFDRDGSLQLRVARAWARFILRVAGVDVRVEGLDKIDLGDAYVFASNHVSYMDTPVVLANIPVQFRFLAKSGLFRIPFLGGHLKRSGHIPVPRDDPRAAVKTMTDAARAVKEKRISLLIFPEGGRTLGVLEPFKEGAAYIAIKAGAPIVPMSLAGTGAVLARGSGIVKPGRVTLTIGDPIPTATLRLQDRGTLTAQVREQVAAQLGVLEPSNK